MNIYKFHSNPDELIGYTDRDWVFGDEAEKLILQGKEVPKVIGDLYLMRTPITALPDNLTVHGDLWINSTPNLDTNNLPSSLVVNGEIMY